MTPRRASAPPPYTSPSHPSLGVGGLFGTLLKLWPYIWPSDRADLKWRVVWAMVLLLLAKLATIAVPFTFKWAVDALSGQVAAGGNTWLDHWLTWAIAAPVAM